MRIFAGKILLCVFTLGSSLNLLVRLHKKSNCNCKCESQPIRQASAVAPLTFPRGQRFTPLVLKARRSHSAANKWLRECIITAFWFSCSHARGTVVTARWESSHVLIPAGFLSSNWLDRLLSIRSLFYFFYIFFCNGQKQSAALARLLWFEM